MEVRLVDKITLIWETADDRRCYARGCQGQDAWRTQWKDAAGHIIPKGTLMRGSIKIVKGDGKIAIN